MPRKKIEPPIANELRTLLDKTIQGEIDKRKVTPAKAKTLQAETRKLIEEVVKEYLRNAESNSELSTSLEPIEKQIIEHRKHSSKIISQTLQKQCAQLEQEMDNYNSEDNSFVQDTKATELLERRVDEVMEVCGALRGSLDETEHKLDKLISISENLDAALKQEEILNPKASSDEATPSTQADRTRNRLAWSRFARRI